MNPKGPDQGAAEGLSVHYFMSHLESMRRATHATDGMCAACGERQESSSEDVGLGAVRIAGRVRFRVADIHWMGLRGAGKGESGVRGVVAATNGEVRVAVWEGEKVICFVAILACIRSLRVVERSLEIELPFVNLVCEVPSNRTSGVSGVRANVSDVLGIKRLADAITALGKVSAEGRSDVHSPVRTADTDASQGLSLFDEALAKAEAENGDIIAGRTEKILDEFVWRGAAMTLPYAFPYGGEIRGSARVAEDRRNYSLLVTAFLQQQIALQNAETRSREAVAAMLDPRLQGAQADDVMVGDDSCAPDVYRDAWRECTQ